MSKKRTNRTLSEEQLKRYLDGTSPPQEAYEVERIAFDSAFDQEALDGFEGIKSERLSRDLTELRKHIPTKKASDTLYRFAAVIALLITASVATWMLWPDSPQKNLAYQETAKPPQELKKEKIAQPSAIAKTKPEVVAQEVKVPEPSKEMKKELITYEKPSEPKVLTRDSEMMEELIETATEEGTTLKDAVAVSGEDIHLPKSSRSEIAMGAAPMAAQSRAFSTGAKPLAESSKVITRLISCQPIEQTNAAGDFKCAVPVGGFEALDAFVIEKISNRNLEGEVFLLVQLNTQGELVMVQVDKTSDDKLGSTVLEAMREGLNWIPAMQGNQAVACELRLLLRF